MFQSTHPCGVRLKAAVLQTIVQEFQSTHPCGVRLALPFSRITKQCFNPRTRVGCDFGTAKNGHDYLVSIHAPVWGATYHLSCQTPWTVSIHAPVWGATTLQAYYQNGSTVSIHAPVWGATINTKGEYANLKFQSTHPCGVRR